MTGVRGIVFCCLATRKGEARPADVTTPGFCRIGCTTGRVTTIYGAFEGVLHSLVATLIFLALGYLSSYSSRRVWDTYSKVELSTDPAFFSFRALGRFDPVCCF